MTPFSSAPRKRDTLSIHIEPEERSLIDRVGSVRVKARTDFVIEATCLAAEEVLLDQGLIVADPDVYGSFLACLDKAPQPNDCLIKTMRTTPPWQAV